MLLLHTKKIRRHAAPIAIGMLLLAGSIALAQMHLSMQLPAMVQEKALEEITQKTYQEYAAMRTIPEVPAEWQGHESAPVYEQKSIWRVILDEIARWFGITQ